MDGFESVQEAYSAMSQRYVDLFDGNWDGLGEETALVRRHLTGLTGTVLDLGCGPGHWTAYLDSFGVDVVGVDLVPEFIAHARSSHPGLDFRIGSMTELGFPDQSIAGILAWYSTIHVPPSDVDRVLTELRRVLAPSAPMVLGFFDSDEDVAAFDHAVATAYRWPVDVFARRLRAAGFVELERLQRRVPARPDRRYAGIAVRAR